MDLTQVTKIPEELMLDSCLDEPYGDPEELTTKRVFGIDSKGGIRIGSMVGMKITSYGGVGVHITQ